MATVTAISTSSGSTGKQALEYITQDQKTDNKRLVTALNCSVPTAHQEFMNTKNLFGKTGGVQFYHFVQSHRSGYKIKPELAHKIAVEFAEKAFGKYECVVATHIDNDHIHSHFVFNSVSFDDGKKYHSCRESLNELRELSDSICQKYGVETLTKDAMKQSRTNGMTAGEYRAAERKESWKVDLMATINLAMKRAKSKEHFIGLMRERGYGVRWEDGRKYITYKTPTGNLCRDVRLHREKYLKEMMEYEFRIREEIFGGIGGDVARERRKTYDSYTDQHSEGYGHADSIIGAGQSLDSGDRSALEADRAAGTDSADRQPYDDKERNGNGNSKGRAALLRNNSEDRGNTVGDHDGITAEQEGTVITGWEPERAVLLQAERGQRAELEAEQKAVTNKYYHTITARGVISDLEGMAWLIDSAPTDPEELERYIDATRAAQNAGFIIGVAVGAIKLLSDRLEEMKYESQEVDEDESEEETEEMILN